MYGTQLSIVLLSCLTNTNAKLLSSQQRTFELHFERLEGLGAGGTARTQLGKVGQLVELLHGNAKVCFARKVHRQATLLCKRNTRRLKALWEGRIGELILDAII